jgi:hypothetical protein
MSNITVNSLTKGESYGINGDANGVLTLRHAVNKFMNHERDAEISGITVKLSGQTVTDFDAPARSGDALIVFYSETVAEGGVKAAA